MSKELDELIDVEYLSRIEEDLAVKEFEKEYKKELQAIRNNIPYIMVDRFNELISYHSKYFDLLKKEIFKKGFFLGLKAKIPD